MKRLLGTWLLTTFFVTVFSLGLRFVESIRLSLPWLVFALPLAGIAILFDHENRKSVLRSRDVVIAMAGGAARLPRGRHALLVGPCAIALTWLNHLVGASVGREGVGIQIGGWASGVLGGADETGSRGLCLRVGVATGISVLFGAPASGLVFVAESLRFQLPLRDALIVLGFAVSGDRLAQLCGVRHELASRWTAVSAADLLGSSPFPMLLFGFLVAIFSALMARLYFRVLDASQSACSRRAKTPGQFKAILFSSLFCMALFLWSQGPNSPYAGLGTALFLPGNLANDSHFLHGISAFGFVFLKIALTGFCVGIGLRGGEVTPLLMTGVAGSVALMQLAISVFQDLSETVASQMLVLAVPVGSAIIWGVAARRPFTAAFLAFEVFTGGRLVDMTMIPLVYILTFVSRRLFERFGSHFSSRQQARSAQHLQLQGDHRVTLYD